MFGCIGFVFNSCYDKKTETENNNVKVAHKIESEPQKIPIWNKSIPDFKLIKDPETYHDGMIKNVSKSTMTVFSPKGKNSSAAGYNKLTINLEGSEICK